MTGVVVSGNAGCYVTDCCCSVAVSQECLYFTHSEPHMGKHKNIGAPLKSLKCIRVSQTKSTR